MSFLALFAGILRMLLGVGRMFLALHVVVLSVLLGRGAMGLGGILVMFRRLIVGAKARGSEKESFPTDWPMRTTTKTMHGQ